MLPNVDVSTKDVLKWLNIPGLQRGRCVSCGGAADAFCANCGVTPYCSANCQRVDWNRRHKNVCHNLERLFNEANSVAQDENLAPNVPAVAPLRRPKSPAGGTLPKSEPKENNSISRNFRPAGSTVQNEQSKYRNSLNHANNNVSRNDGSKRFYNRTPNQHNKENAPYNNNNRFDNRNNNRHTLEGKHQQNNVPAADEDEEWGAAKPVAQPRTEPQPVQESNPKPEPVKQEPAAATPATPMLSVSDVTPKKKFVPKNYVMDLLTPGSTAVLVCESLTNKHSEAIKGMVCVSMHEDFSASFERLCEDYSVYCQAEAEVVDPTVGDLFSLLNPEDGGWYRARLLNKTEAALVDSGKIMTFNPPAKKVSSEYIQIPEMCCLLICDAVKEGDSVQCTILSKLDSKIKVSLTDVPSGASLGEAIVTRWMPHVEYPVVNNTAKAVELPTVPRPVLRNKSSVLLVDATNLTRVLIRSSEAELIRQFDDAVAQTLLFASEASPLTEPPQKGQMVIGMYTDGLHYRALCKRTSVKQNKYLIEYIEYGNEEITTLEKLYPCPPELGLEQCPCLSSVVNISTTPITPQCTEYLLKLTDDAEPMVLTLPSGEETAPSGSEAVLTVAKKNENLNKTIEKLCSPEWKAIKDVIETERIMFSALAYQPLHGDCELHVLDVGDVASGSVSACVRRDTHYDFVTGPLTARMTEYCLSDIGKEPYLPMPEELCIAQFPPDPTWYRAVAIQQLDGPGGDTVRVMYIDYGNVGDVPRSVLRKMLREFVDGVPALANSVEIQGFPKDPTTEQLQKCLQYMKINDEGRGVLKPDKVVKQPGEDGVYTVFCQGLLDAMNV